MKPIEYFEEQFDQRHALENGNGLSESRREAFNAFRLLGIPDSRHEEWKYTRIGGLFNKDFVLSDKLEAPLQVSDLDTFRLPGNEQANELFFINGRYSESLSIIRSPELEIMLLEQAAHGPFKEIVSTHFGHSASYQKDGINALNTAFVKDGLFIHVKKGQQVILPVYIYNITDSRSANILSQPRSLVHVAEDAQVVFVETSGSIGSQEIFTNQVIEVVVEKDAMVEYYKIQNETNGRNLVSTTHFRQVGKSHTHIVTITLDGGIIRNNLNIVLEAEHCESHLYGLYFPGGHTLVDNHTVVDNVKPHCFSNELYKGIMADRSTGVFNGKIFVRADAQKTNAYQSNKNVLLSDNASVNTKPQLEIFADDVKCSHGCTIGKLDEEGLFYLQSRGIPENKAVSLLLHGFAMDVLEKVKPVAIRAYVDKLIDKRLELI